MGRELQKKKNRSSIPKVRQKPKSKRINPLGNAIVAANWDSTQTLTQNYSRLGLASRLNSVTGGIDKTSKTRVSKTSTASQLAISNVIPTVIAPSKARVERDPETGKIIRVIHEGQETKRKNPLNDPLNTDDEDDCEMNSDLEGREQNLIVQELELQAASMAQGEKRIRKQSDREKEWITKLVQRYGDDFGRMARDGKLNPMQQTEADIRRRVAMWKAAQ